MQARCLEIIFQCLIFKKDVLAKVTMHSGGDHTFVTDTLANAICIVAGIAAESRVLILKQSAWLINN